MRRRESREAMQRDRDAGVGVSELAKKYGVSRVTIYKRTRSNGTDNRSSSRLIECEKVHGRALRPQRSYETGGEMSFDEISRQMGCTPQTVGRIYARAVKKIRAEFRRRGLDSDSPVRCTGAN